MKSTTVTLNGTVYDTATGKPLRHERGHHAAAKPKAAQHVHTQQQRSRTLNRRYIRRDTPAEQSTPAVTTSSEDAEAPRPAAPAHKRVVTPAVSVHRAPTAPAHTVQHAAISKFTKPATPAKRKATHRPDITPVPHAMATAAKQRAQVRQATPVAAHPKPSQVIKQESIAAALDKTTPKSHKKDVHQKKQQGKVRRFAGLASAALAIVLLGGYLTYLNMPSLSTRVAAAQAGVDASYPGYLPSGYSLSGPVAYQQGSVSMKFAANSSPRAYTLTQSESDWDSSAVLEKSVVPNSANHYTTSTISGLTIYSYDGVSTWVNNGILYTLTGNASLSDDQVQHIATSL